MSRRILIAYATRAGSTTGVAEAVAGQLRRAGYDPVISEIHTDPSPEEYDHVILGGPVYMGHMSEVAGYVQRHEAALQSRLIAAFAVGMSFLEDDKEKQAPAQEALRSSLSSLLPRHIGYFAGKTDPGKLSFLQRMALKIVKSPVGDFRDYEAIQAWAMEISGDLQRA
ncbi:flavodoxin domain-containing protein [Methanocalculus taiwanensis]|nr:flavodoxin domain-containing protein [Methanocalculus taiwanensis]